MKQTILMKQQIIEVATDLAQKYGLNAFSYHDISKIVGITKASIHHHFPAKADLSYAILEQYSINFFNTLAVYEKSSPTPLELLTKYIDVFKSVALQDNKICLCFMYASDYLSLAESTQELVKEFYLANEAWLAKKIAVYSNQNETETIKYGRMVFSALQGVLVRSRIFGASNDFDNLTQVFFRACL